MEGDPVLVCARTGQSWPLITASAPRNKLSQVINFILTKILWKFDITDTACIFIFHILLLLILVHAWYVFRGRHCLLCQFRVWWNRIPHNCDKPRQCVSVQLSQILLLCTYFTNYEITVSLLIFFIMLFVHIMEMIWL